MARTVTVADIFRRAKKRADQVSSNFFTQTDLFDLINSSSTLLYDQMVQAYANYFVDTFSFAIAPGTASYPLPSDFYKSINVEREIQPDRFVPVFPVNELEKTTISGTDASNLPVATIRIRYVPSAPVYTLTTDVIDGVSGWDDLIVADMAIAMLGAEESDTSAAQAYFNRTLARIQSIAPNRDITNPGTVTDVTAYNDGSLQNALQYIFYGNSIEFYNITYYGI